MRGTYNLDLFDFKINFNVGIC